MTKEGRKRNRILFGKYRLLHRLGSGRSGTVWLAVHLGLEEYRAIKCVSRKCADYETFRREALILKELQHPGIPQIYDLEEDSEYFYLIEEFLQGNSLYTLVKHQGALQEADAVRYGMQICGLVEYMHSAYKLPILYLDLQPNNLIICDGAVKLIDFDHAARFPDANQERLRYGTAGCAAPEQYSSDHILDQRTDIYAIGAVLRFMLCGTLKQEAGISGSISGPLQRIIRKCMDPDMDKRYGSAKEAEAALRMLCVRETAVNQEGIPDSSLIIYLAGMRPGAGVTHLAFGLLHFLTKQGWSPLYEEHNHSRAVRELSAHESARPDEKGIYTIKGSRMKPWYGPAVRLDRPLGYRVILRDYGTDWNQLAKDAADGRGVLIAVAAASPWESCFMDPMVSFIQTVWNRDKNRKTVVVFRHTQGGYWKWPLKDRRLHHSRQSLDWDRLLKQAMVFASPEYNNPFMQQKETETFLRSLWKVVSGGRPGKAGKSWTDAWEKIKEAFLNAGTAPQEDAGSQVLPEQGAGQG